MQTKLNLVNISDTINDKAVKMMIPRVSIVMAAYNANQFLAEALDDLLAQTFTDFELIVVDDGSTDGTLAMLDSYAAADARIIVLKNEINLGLPTSLNLGIKHCRAALIARADADDRYPPDRLAKQVAFLDAHPEVGLLSGAVDKIDAHGKYLLSVRFPTEDGQIRMRELFLNSFTHPGVMYRTELVRSIGGYDPEYFTSEDADLYSRLRPVTIAANLEDKVVYYRKHGAASTQNRKSKDVALSLSVRQRLLSGYLQRPVGIDEAEALQAVYWARKKYNLTVDQLIVARRGFKEIFRQAKRCENSDTLRFFKSEVCRALLAAARSDQNLPGMLRWRLFTEVFWWDPRMISTSLRDRLNKSLGREA